jgi:hypothetical protein
MTNQAAKLRVALFVMCSLLMFAPAKAAISEIETGNAQGAMLKRIDSVVAEYVERRGIDESYVDYCRTKLNMETSREPSNGMIPYGADYTKMATSEELRTVISSRENFERSYLILCLANAKNTLAETSSTSSPASELASQKSPFWAWVCGAFLLVGFGFILGRRTGNLK